MLIQVYFYFDLYSSNVNKWNYFNEGACMYIIFISHIEVVLFVLSLKLFQWAGHKNGFWTMGALSSLYNIAIVLFVLLLKLFQWDYNFDII